MKVLHLSYSAPPDPPGGTEVYVADLSRELAKRGVTSVIAAPGAADQSFEAGDLSVRRFAFSGRAAIEDVYGSGDVLAAEAFDRLLAQERPDVVQQHALTPACSVEVARRVKRRRIPLVFTYHTPTVSCARGTLLRWGREACDGRLDAAVCSRCLLESHGIPPLMGRMVSAIGSAVASGLEAAGAAGGALTALRLPRLIATQQEAIREFFDLADVIVAPTGWVRELLVENGVPADRITMSRHGVTPRTARPRFRIVGATAPLRLVHLGRMDPTKGTRLLLLALRDCSDAPLELDIYGVGQGTSGRAMLDDLQTFSRDDRRVRFLPPVPHDEVIETLASYDAVVVPSQLMETGPLVVLEAFAAGVPVIGSDLGGIAAHVRRGVDGLLVNPFDAPSAWARVLDDCSRSPEMIRELAPAVRVPRTTGAVADDMIVLYQRVVGERVALGHA